MQGKSERGIKEGYKPTAKQHIEAVWDFLKAPIVKRYDERMCQTDLNTLAVIRRLKEKNGYTSWTKLVSSLKVEVHSLRRLYKSEMIEIRNGSDTVFVRIK